MKTDTSKNNLKKNQQSKLRSSDYQQYLKYSGLAMQMAAMVAVGYWIGKKIDSWLYTGYPVFTILMICLFLFAAMYSLIKNLPKN